MNCIRLIFLCFFVFLIFIGCSEKKKNDNFKKLAILFVADQNSGNCAIVTKSSSNSINTYTASGTRVVKGGCNENNLGSIYTTDSNIAKAAADSYYDDIRTALNTASSSNCSAIISTVDSAKSSVTSNTIASSANSSSNGCSAVYGKTIYCKDQTSITNAKAKIQYIPTQDVSVDMKSSLDVIKTNLNTSKVLTGFSSANISLTQTPSQDDLTFLNSSVYTAYTIAVLSTSCQTSLVNANPTLKSILGRLIGKSTSGITGITDASNIVPLTFLTCGYGDGFGTPASNSTTQKCSVTYSSF